MKNSRFRAGQQVCHDDISVYSRSLPAVTCYGRRVIRDSSIDNPTMLTFQRTNANITQVGTHGGQVLQYGIR